MMMRTEAKKQGSIDQRLVKALGHPIRIKVLTLLNERVASPSELAEELDEPLGNVSYHVRTLLELDCIELVRTAPRRGAVEHYYRAIQRPWFSDADWSQLPESLKRSFSGEVIEQIWTAIGNAARAGSFSKDDSQLLRTTLELDEEGYDELRAEVQALQERAFEIQARSAVRLAQDGDERRAELVLMLFDSIKPAKRS